VAVILPPYPLHMNTASPATDDRSAMRNVAVLVAAQAIIGAQLPMMFTVAGLAGTSLSANPCWATLPITAMVLGSMLSATPLSALMARFGRRAGFVAGTIGGALGAAISAYGLYSQSFVFLVIGALFTGSYMSAQGFFRFAATDTASDAFRPKAISYVMVGGLLSAITGNIMLKATDTATAIPYLGTYMAVIALNLVGMFLFAFLNSTRPAPLAAGESTGRSRMELLASPRILVAVICATVSYALMNLMMTSSPIAVVGCGFTKGNATDVVTFHVLAMYVPSFFTGHLIARFGAEKIVGTGLAILVGAGIVAYAGVDLMNFFAALILLGLGWNFGFIGATAMLTASHTPAERGRMQGLNDLIVFGGVTLASLSSGGLMNCSGGTIVESWHAVTLAMAPFLILAGAALIWLAARRQTA
jgi:Major Facilitator Superfamily